MNALDGAIDSTRELIALEGRKIETLKELLRSLIVMRLLGHEKASDIKGRLSTRVREDGATTFPTVRNFTFVVFVDGEQALEVPLKDVPQELWPADVLERHLRAEQRKAERSSE